MIKPTVLTSFLAKVLLLLFAGAVFGQADPRLGVRLSLGEGKSSYRSGEPITLVLTFNSYVPGYSVNVGQEVTDTVMDDVIVTPSKGVFEWKKQYMRGAKYTSDHIPLHSLNDGPAKVELPLNHFVRFDAPGRYTVRIKTRRVWLSDSEPTKDPIVELLTNEVTFDVTMMTEKEEAAEVAFLASALDKAAAGSSEQTRLVTRLSYLSGNAAIAEKIRWYLTPQGSGNYQSAAGFGLLMSKDRALVIKMLERIFRDIDRPVSHDLFSSLVSLRLLHEVPVPVKPVIRTPFFYEPEPDEQRIRNAYLKEIVESLPRRKGKNLNETAFLVLQNLPKKDPPPEVLATVRRILVRNFDELSSFGQEMLLTAYWQTVRDPALIPSLERVFKNQSYPDYVGMSMRSRALRRLDELDPVRARPYLIATILDPESMLDDDIVFSLDNSKPIPEVDASLVRQIRTLSTGDLKSFDWWRLRSRCILAGRFASAAAFDELLDIYNTDGDKWEQDSRAFMLGYISRFNPQQALELLRIQLTQANVRASMFLGSMTRIHYASELTPFLEGLLAADDYGSASAGAYILSKHGPASSRAKIEKRLERWTARWRDREFELEGLQMKPEDRGQAMLQVELIQALRDGKNWKISEAELKDLMSECKTEICQQHFRHLKASIQ